MEGDQFGNVQPQVAMVKLPLRHAGQYADDETGLFYNYFRFYDPATGRYVTSDPIGLDGGLNTYGYVGGSPLSSTDFYGLFPDSVTATCARDPAFCASLGINTAGASVAIAVSNTDLNSQVKTNQELYKNCDNECQSIYQEIKSLIGQIRNRTKDMQFDKCNQYQLAYSVPNPSLSLGCNTTTWLGHRTQIEGLQNRLRKKITRAYNRGCWAVPPRAWLWAWRGIPNKPRGLF